MKKIILRNLPFQKKLLLIYFTCVILPLFLVSVFFFSITVMKWDARGRADVERNVNNVKSDIQQLFDKVLLNVDYIYYDDTLYDLLSVTEGNPQQFLDIAEKIDMMFQPFLLNETTQRVQIFSSNQQLYRSSVLKKRDDLEKEAWYPDFLQNGRSVAFVHYYDARYGGNVLSVVKRLDYKTQENEIHILKVDLPENQISNSLRANSSVDNIYLLDQNNIVIAVRSYSEGYPQPKYAVGDIMDVNHRDVICQSLDLLGEYKAAAKYSRRSIGSFDFEMGVFILLILLSLLVSTWMIKLVDKSVTNKLKELTLCLKNLENEEFTLIDESDAGMDEIGILSRGMNCAVKKIEFLINEVYAEKMRKLEIEKEKEKTELKALLGQVDPHFMFNVFEVVRMKSLKNGDIETSNIMKSISVMFRRLINSRDDMITLKDELAYVSAYLNVSNYSMDDEVEIKLDIDEKALLCKIPKMTIQVFVENAFNHGLENIDDGRRFALSVKEENKRLAVCVTDNGIGMDEETVTLLNEGRMEQRQDGSGVGIMNVLKRLKLYFDNDFEFQISSVPQRETKVTIVIPAKKG